MRGERSGRFVRTAAFVSGLGALGIFALLPSAAAAPQPTLTATAIATVSAAPDLSTVPKIMSYLRSQGVDPRGVVVQRGAKNYAGPNCPGFAWNCTAARGVVVQMAQAGQNKFECSPEGDQQLGTDEATTCILFQSTSDGKNQATCRESSNANPVTLTCDITQINDTGDNHATIDQNVKQVGGATQEATVIGRLDQNNFSGSNHASVAQTISQSTSDVSVLLGQEQTANFDVELVEQDTGTGNNFLQMSQALTQDGRASGSDDEIEQEQNGDHFGEVDQDVFGEGGDSLLSGMVGFLLAADEGFSKAHVTQTERQTLRGPGSQSQSGPMGCCGAGSQEGSPQQTLFTLHQNSTQKASQFGDGNVNQFQFLRGDCNTTGTCSINQGATNEADSLNQKTSGTGIQELFTTCSAFSGEGSGGVCVPEDEGEAS